MSIDNKNIKLEIPEAERNLRRAKRLLLQYADQATKVLTTTETRGQAMPPPYSASTRH